MLIFLLIASRPGSFPNFVLFDMISLCYVCLIGLLLLFLDLPVLSLL